MTPAKRSGVAALAALALFVLTLLSVQGCQPGTAVQASDTAQIVVTPEKAQAVFQSYLQVSDDAAAAGAMASGLGVVTNSAWEATHAQYLAMDIAHIPVPRYVYGAPQFFLPRLNSYPHWFMTAVPRHPVGSSASATSLMVFAQLTDHAKWTLTATTDLAPGQSLPAITKDSAGYVTALPAGETSVLVRPDVVGATQAAVVDDGPASAASTLVTDGPLTTGLYQQQNALAAAAASQHLHYTWLMMGSGFPVYALRTADGGALVLYGMIINTTTEHPNHTKGQAIPVPADIRHLIPASQVALHAYAVTETYQYAAIDPPATAHDAKITVIAASGGPTYAHAF